MLVQFLKNCSKWARLTLDQFVENCIRQEGPHSGAGEECEEEGTAETTCDKLTETPIARPPVALRGRRWRIHE